MSGTAAGDRPPWGVVPEDSIPGLLPVGRTDDTARCDLRHGEPAADREGLAGDEPGVVGDDEGYGAGDVIRLAEAAHRDPPLERVDQLVVAHADHRLQQRRGR